MGRFAGRWVGGRQVRAAQVEGGKVFAAWDWWSLGMIAAELAVGRRLRAS